MPLTALLYGCETWTVYQRHAKTLNRFHLNCLRKLHKIKWQDKIPDTEVLTRSNMMSIHTLLKKYQLRWTGHVVRMQDTRLPKKILFGELKSGKRSRGGQKKRFKDTLKVSLKSFNVDLDNWETLAQERDAWRSIITDGALTSESNRIKEAETKRQLRKSRTNSTDSVASIPTNLSCPVCHRVFRAGIGLIRHMRTHKSF